MKTIILAGGLGTRLSEKTQDRPKPMVEIGGKPILWHIMNIYAAAGFNEFIVALGYKSELIKEYFLNFYALNNDISVDLSTGTRTIHQGSQPNWKIHLIDTGMHTMTGSRVKKLKDWIGNETFMMTYGDGLCDVDVKKIVEFHKKQSKLATVTGVRPPARFGGLTFDGHHVKEFSEKPQIGEGWINGGFFVLEPQVLDLIEDDTDQVIFERGPLEKLAELGQLVSYKHDGFWQPMDTLREYHYLEELWKTNKAPWKVW